MESTSSRQLRRLSWFNHGMHAIGCVRPQSPKAYLCPICRSFFTAEQLATGEVTDEHIPPRAVGGKALVLTCRVCNAASGRELDEAVANEEKRRTFGTSHALGALPATVVFEGSRNNGSIRFDGETFLMAGDPGQNDPDSVKAYMESFSRFGKGSTLELEIRMRGNRRRAAVGWLRAAYLSAFALYGYRYILQAALDPLIDTIRHPDGTGVEPLILTSPKGGALDPLIGEVTSPATLLGCVAVVFGPRLVLLPPWAAQGDWISKAREHLQSERPASLSLRPIIDRRFPQRPLHLTDG